MADGAPPSLERTERGLTYPQPALPLSGEAVTVGDGVLWMRLALPIALDHINVYAIADGDGWVLVDTGLSIPSTHAEWEKVLAGPLGGKPIHRLIVTHLHPDHIGAAGWLYEKTGAPLLMSRLEYVCARMYVTEDASGPTPEAESFFHRQGWDDDAIARWKANTGRFSRSISPIPPQYTRLQEGEVLLIGGREWTVVIGAGHSPEHVCLWRKDDDVFIAGDQILPKISSNIGVWDTEPLADPLKDWLLSLEDLKSRLPEDLLVLPSHGEPFYGVTTRLEALLRGHEVGLKRLMRSLQQKSRSIDVFGALFARQIGPELLGMATSESLAHLNYLEGQGRAVREIDEHGVEWWSAVEGTQ